MGRITQELRRAYQGGGYWNAGTDFQLVDEALTQIQVLLREYGWDARLETFPRDDSCLVLRRLYFSSISV